MILGAKRKNSSESSSSRSPKGGVQQSFIKLCADGDLGAIKQYFVENPDAIQQMEKTYSPNNAQTHEILEGFREAVVQNHLEVVEYLLSIPEIQSKIDHVGNWPLRLAFLHNRLRIADRLLRDKGVEDSCTDRFILTNLGWAADNGRIGVFLRLLELPVAKQALVTKGFYLFGKSKLDVMYDFISMYAGQHSTRGIKLKEALDVLTDEFIVKQLLLSLYVGMGAEADDLLIALEKLDFNKDDALPPLDFSDAMEEELSEEQDRIREEKEDSSAKRDRSDDLSESASQEEALVSVSKRPVKQSFQILCDDGDLEGIKQYFEENPNAIPEMVSSQSSHEVLIGFYCAIVKNHLEVVEYLLTKPEIVSKSIHAGNRSLFLAFVHNRLRIADRLLKVESIEESFTTRHIKSQLLWATDDGNIGVFQRLLELPGAKEAVLEEGCDPVGKSKLDIIQYYINKFLYERAFRGINLRQALNDLKDPKIMEQLRLPLFVEEKQLEQMFAQLDMAYLYPDDLLEAFEKMSLKGDAEKPAEEAPQPPVTPLFAALDRAYNEAKKEKSSEESSEKLKLTAKMN